MKKASFDNFRRRLLAWYGAQGRHSLPWRNTRDPYAIYISEIMLQQTQVATVEARYYGPFLKRFPTLAALAEAAREDVLKAWQGLGYYNRAINLHEAAKQCKASLPSDTEALMSLPGVGRNTAHAVAAFAYGQKVAVMEANVRRVVSRIFALEKPAEQELWERAEALLDRAHPFDYNQAMMDVGALLCTRRNPRCGECPAQSICLGQSSPESYPAARSKKQVKVRRKHIVVQRDKEGKFFATPRQGKFLNGLYHFKEFEILQHKIPAYAGMTKIGSVRQPYSHFTLEADIFLQQSRRSGEDWHSFAQLKALPMSMAEKKIIALLEAHAAH